MNAFLQILLHTPYFLKILYEYKDFDNSTLIFNLKMLSIYPSNSEYLKQIKKIMGNINPKYGTLTPGDSQNFAIDFLDKLISESKEEESNEDSYESNYDKVISKIKKYQKFCENYNNKKDKIEKLFQFTEISKLNGNFNFSVYLNIELSFPQNCCNKISLIRLLNDKYSGGNINKPKLADLPEILIISIVRGIEGKNVLKTNVSFDEELDLRKYLDSDLTKNLKCSSYQLYAVNERYGQYKSQGHYVCFIKVNNEKWYRFSDLYVVQSDPPSFSPDVFGLYYIRNDLIKKY
jgi:ubiquitin C-terminal hydrolase